jgi:hypothetical protein
MTLESTRAGDISQDQAFQDNKKSPEFPPEYVFTRVIFRNAVPESWILSLKYN